MTINRKKLCKGLFVLLLLAWFAQPPVRAQWGTPKKVVQVNKYTIMIKEIPLPDVPAYTGKKLFKTGATVSAPGEGGGVSYVETYLVKESIDDVSKWYAGALVQTGWKVTLQTRQSVYANKDGASVSLNLNGTHEPGWRSAFSLNYTPRGPNDGK